MIIPVLTDIDPIEGNCPFGRVIEAAKQLDQGGLSGTIGADYSQTPSAVQLKRYVLEGVFGGAGIPEADMVKGEYIVIVVALFRGQCTLILGVGQIQKGKERGQILAVLPESLKLRCSAGEAVKQLIKGPGILDDAACRAGAAQGAQAHEEIDQAGN